MANAQTIQVNLKVMGDVQDVISNMSQVQKALTSLKLPDNLKNSFSKTFQDITKETTKIQSIMSSGFKNKGDVTALEKSYQKINQLIFGLQNNLGKITPNILQESFQIDTQALEKATKEVEKFKKQLQTDISTAGLDGITQKVKELTDAGKGGKSLQNFFEQLKSGNFSAAEKSIKTLESSLAGVETRLKNSGKDTSGIEEYRNKIEQIHNAFNALVGDSAVQQTNDQLIKALQNVQNLNQTELTNFINQFNNTKAAVEKLPPQINKVSDAQRDAGRASVAMANDMDQIRSRIQYFFGLTSAVNLFKRAVKSAFDTVKELDKTMTEAAVVTEFDVSDMWSQLPTYASQAKALGATINDLYGATTLYYQQGLKTKEAMELGNETLRMARIGSLDAADATQYMTAALRGFNMEINQISGERVNDVYSKLAAITASDTAQIAIAMSKTASIANSANMEFENTAALLSQIIETTQEAPETAGTALKTIIARFSEVKKLTEKGLFSGEDEEGEIIEVNKISSALASVGISMNKFFAGEEGLDSILMKLASKWDSLDFSTQRYIATAAAGSRQQSRFIAMMSNYDRTLELADAASNSAGASQEQFGKTLESLDSKLNKLKDAWDQFTMGLANSDLIKGVIDGLTGFLDTINKIINSISGGKGFAKTVTSALLAFGAFKLGKNALGFGNREGGLLQALIGNKKQISKQGKEISFTFAESIKRNFGKDAKGNGLFQDYFTTTTKVPFDFSQLAKGKSFDREGGKGIDVLMTVGTDTQVYNQLLDKYIAAENAVEQFGAKSDEAKKALEDLNSSAEKAGIGIQKTSTNLNAVAHASQLAGAGLVALSSTFDTSTEAGKFFSGVIKGIGVGLLSFGTILPAVQAAVDAFAVGTTAAIDSIPIIGWIAGIISLLIALGTALANAFDWRSDTKKAEDGLKAIQETVEKTKDSLDGLNSSLEEIGDKRSAIDKMVTGTMEWQTAVAELNSQILELVKNSKFLDYNDIFIDQNGIMSINEKAQQNAQKQQLEMYQSQQRANFSQELALSKKQSKDAWDKVTRDQVEAFANYQNGPFITAIDQAKLGGFESKKFKEMAYQLASNGLMDKNLVGTKQFNDFLAGLNYSKEEINNFSTLLKYAKDELYSDVQNATQLQSQADKSQSSLLGQQALNRMGLVEGTKDYSIAKTFSDGSVFANEWNDRRKQLDKNKLDENENYKQWAKNTYDPNAIVKSDGSIIYYEENEQGKLEQKTVEKDAAKDQYVGEELSLDLQDRLKNVIQGVAGIADETIQKLLTGGSLTEDEISKIESKIPKVISDNGFEEIYKNNIEQQKKLNEEGSSRLKEISNEFNNTANKSNLTGESKNVIADQYAKVSSLTTKEDANILVDGFSNFLNNNSLSSEDKNKILESMGAYDFSDAKEIDSFINKLKEMGYDLDDSSNGLGTLISKLIGLQSTLNGFTTENISSQLLKLSDYRKSLLDKDSLSFTEQEKQDAINYGAATENDFIQTGEDEWQYVSGSINNLISALDANTEAQILEGKLKLDNQLEVAEQTDKFMKYQIEHGSEGYAKKFASGDLEGTTTKTAISALRAYSDFFGDTDNKVFKNTETGEKLSYDDIKGNAELAQTIYNQIVAAMAIGSEGIRKQIQAYEDSRFVGQSNTAVEANGGTSDEIIGAVYNDAEQAGFNTQEIQSYAEALQLINTRLDEVTAAQVALANSKMNAGLGEIINSYKDWSEIIDEDTGALKDTSSEGVATYNKLKASVNKMLNTSKDLSKSFWDNANNMKNIRKAAEGDTKALGELQKAAAKDYLMQIAIEADTEEARNAILTLSDYIGETELPPLEAGIELTGYEDFISRCNELIKAGNMTSQQVSDAFKAMGYDVDFDPNPQPITTNHVVPVTSYSVSGSMEDGSFRMTPHVEMKSFPYTETVNAPTVKTLTSTGSGGGGVSAKNTSAGKGKKGGGGGGGSSKKPEKQHWKNPYDKLYNANDKINETLRDREALEKAYDRLLQNRDASAQKLLKNSRQQVQNLKEEIKLQQQIVNGRASQLKNAKNEDYLGKKKVGDDEEEFWTTFQKEATRLGLGNLDNYATYNQSTGLLQINWDKIEAIENDEKAGEDKGGLIEEYVSYLEEQSKSFEEAQDRLDEINDEVYEIEQRGKEEYLDFSQRIIDAIINQQQKQIDTLSELDDTITDTNSRILDGIQEQVDLSRQIRDNTKTEDEIAKKEARLAYLRRDTSGANALEIKKLEEELNDARENYSDQLVDQALQKLSDDNEKASQQRQDQIELMQTQLDYWTEIGAFNARMEELFSGAFNKDGTLNNNSELVKLLQETEGFQALSKFGKEDWMQKLAEDFYAATEGQSNFKVDEAKANKKIASGMAVNTSGKSVGALTYNSSKGWVSSTGTYGTISWDESLGKYIVDNYTANPKTTSSTASATSTATAGASAKGKLSSLKDGKVYNNGKAEIKKLQEGINSLIADKKISGVAKLATDGIYGAKTKAAVKVIQKMIGVTADGLWGKNTSAAFKKSSLKAYKLGGLADFTGPAWLDGSKSKPEMVLNPQDTKNFIILKDVLGKLLEGDNLSSEKGGDNYYEIHINVDEIANDYDVDKLIDKVKKEINNDARYRNVNAINLLR